jgi:hypothetical protein
MFSSLSSTIRTVFAIPNPSLPRAMPAVGRSGGPP